MRHAVIVCALFLSGHALADDGLTADQVGMVSACLERKSGEDCVGKAADACAEANTLNAPNAWQARTWCAWAEAALWAKAARIDAATLPRKECPHDADNDTMDDPFPMLARDAEVADCAMREAAHAALGTR